MVNLLEDWLLFTKLYLSNKNMMFNICFLFLFCINEWNGRSHILNFVFIFLGIRILLYNCVQQTTDLE